jgi:hypothetical protein
MTAVAWDPPFRTARFLVCDLVVSGPGEDLLLVLVEHQALPSETSVSVGGRTIEGLRVVGPSSDSRRWIVYWPFVAAFKSLSESYNFTLPILSGPSGRCLCSADSDWLSELRVGGLLDALEPGCQHFLLLSDHKIFEIVSNQQPSVHEVPDKEFDPFEWLSSLREPSSTGSG